MNKLRHRSVMRKDKVEPVLAAYPMSRSSMIRDIEIKDRTTQDGNVYPRDNGDSTKRATGIIRSG